MFGGQLKNILKFDKIKYTEYFNLWNNIIRLVDPRIITKEVMDTVEVAKLLHKTITSRSIIEDDIAQDPILAGSLLMLSTLDELFHSQIKQGCSEIYSQKFLEFMLSNGLFNREKPDAHNDDLSYPLCKHNQTRKHALRVVEQIFGNKHMVDIARFLEPYIKAGSWRTNKREKWYIQASKLSQRTTHVGLVNLGCTCYMNSLMQQLFMCPHFRNFISVAVDQKKDQLSPEDNVLYQTKYLFANLIKTRMPTYNPIVFFNSIKDFNGEPMPTNEQRDVDEFLNIYMDKIEQNIMGSDDEKHLKSIFGGAFAQELICKGCPHRSSREEPYLSVNLEIKNKSNIKEALELFIQGEMLEGDNAYYCERCDKKVDTLKRCCIKKLPNALILTLKRFEFDLETLSRYKLNSYCEFYDELDMREYCQETLAKKELVKKMKEDNLTYEMLTEDQKAIHDFTLPDIYYKYKLKGTVVHYGTAEGGHYYSFIKERGTDKWFEFNDTNVREYDPADLPDDAFGGKLRHEQKIIQSGKQYIQTEKLNNAYILIYEREEFIDNNKLFELRESERNDLNQLIPSYTLPQKPLKIEQNILEDLTLAYDKHWIASKMFDDFFVDSVINMCLSSCNYLHLNSERALKQAMDVDESDEEIYKLKFATLFTLGVILRSDSRLHFAERILPQIRDTAARSLSFSRWLLNCFCRKHTINEFFTNWWSTQACRMIMGLFKIALRKVYVEERTVISNIIKDILKNQDTSPEATAQLIIQIMNEQTAEVPTSLRWIYQFILVSLTKVKSGEASSLSHFFYFAMIHEFACLDAEIRLVLASFKMHTLCMNLVFSSQPSLDQMLPGVIFGESELDFDASTEDVFQKETLGISEFDDDDLGRFKPFKLNKFERIMISNLNKDTEPFLFQFKVISKIMRSSQIINEAKPKYEESEHRMENTSPIGHVGIPEFLSLVEPSENVCNILFGIRCNNKGLRNELAKLYGHLLFNDERSIYFCKSLISWINQEEYKEIPNYERILYTVLTLEDVHKKERVNSVLNLCMKLMDNNSSEYAFLDIFWGMMIKFAKRNKSFRHLFYQHNIVDRINKWLSSNATPPINSLRGQNAVFRSTKHNNRYSYDYINSELAVIKDYNLKRKNELKQMYKKLQEWEDPDPESEDDLYDGEVEIGSKLDYVLEGTFKWASGTVDLSMGELVRVRREDDEMDVDNERMLSPKQWLIKDESNLAPYKTKATSMKAAVLTVYDKAYNM